MTGFVFPKPGERANASAIPVPPHTLVALLAAAMAWETEGEVSFPGTVPPQLRDATIEVLASLNEAEAPDAATLSQRIMEERAGAEQG